MDNMKGLTQKLKELGMGEQITVTGTERSDIHKTATRLGLHVEIEKFVNGFYVTRLPLVRTGSIQVVTERESVPIRFTSTPSDDKEMRLAIARAALSQAEQGSMPTESRVETASGSLWEEQPAIFENGQWVIYEQHLKTYQKRLVRVEQSYDAA